MGERKPSVRKKWRVATSLLLAILLVLPAGVVKGETLIQDERMEVSFDIFKQNKEDFVKSSTSDDRPACWPYWRGNDIEINGLTPNLNWTSPALDETFKNAISKMLYFDICNCWCCPGHNPHAYCLSEESDPEKIVTVPEGVAFYGKPYCFLIQFDGEPIEHPGSVHVQNIYLAKKDIKLTFHQQIDPQLYGVTLETGDTIDDPGMFVKNIQDYWRDDEYFQKFKLDPEVNTNTAGKTATWIYPEGGQRRHGVGIDVKVVPKYEFEHVTITRAQNPGVSVSEGDFVKVKGGRTLPRWTQVKGHTGDLTLDKIGKREITVDITIPDLVHPKKTIKGTLNVVGRMKDAYEPIGKILSIKRGSFVSQTPEDYIANLKEMPEGTNYYWASDWPNSYDLKKLGLYNFSINARYPDGTEDQAVTTIKVVDEFLNAQNEPIGRDIYVRKGEEPKASDGIANREELKEVNGYGAIRFTAPVDTSTTGTKPAEIEVEYRDWTTDKVNVNVIVVDELECDKYNPQPKDIRVKQHATVDPKWGIANLEELPEDAKIHFVYAVSTEKVGTFNTLLNVVYKDRSVDQLRPKLYVEGPDNELYTPQGKNLTVKQNAVVDAKSGIANTADLPNDATYAFKNGPVDTSKPGEQKATVVVTYADKTTDEVEITITVEKLADNEKYEPQGKNLTVKQNAVVDAKSGIANTADLPNDATYAFKNGAVDTSQPGEQKATVVVTYADKTTDEVEITITVEKLADNEKYEPQGKDIEVEKNGKVDPKDTITNKDKLPEDTTYTFKDGDVDTSKPGEQDVTVVVTYPDKTTDEVTVKVTVKDTTPGGGTTPTQKDNEKYEPETKDIEVEKNGKVDPKDTITNKDKLPEDTTYTFKDGDVDTSKPGEQDVTVVVTYPDKTTDEVTVKVTVKDTTPGGGTTPTQKDNEKYEPETKDIEVEKNGKVDPKDTITNKDKLPEDTTYTFKDGDVDTSKPGEQDVTVVVTYPDKTTDEVTVKVTVKDTTPGGGTTPTQKDNEKYEPETKDIEVEKNGTVDPKDTITNKDKLPEDTTYTFKEGDVDTSKPGEQDVTVVVTYPDKTTDEVTVKVTVKDTTPGGGTTPTQKDNEKYEPETKDIEVEKNGKVDPKDTITNKDKLPEDTTYTFKEGDVDTSKPGEQDVTVVVTYPDKTTDEVTVKVTVKDTTPGGGTTPGGTTPGGTTPGGTTPGGTTPGGTTPGGTTPGGTTPGADIPKDVDTDGDGLTDKKEKEMGTDPSKKDTDGDGLTDKEEADLGTDPLKKDTDGDGYTDGQEVKAGSNPKDKNLVPKKPGNVAAPKTGDPMMLSTLALLLTSAAGAVACGKKNRRK